nr:MAG TPA: hypothetical protein [Herelleviridae sp.]
MKLQNKGSVFTASFWVNLFFLSQSCPGAL